MMKQINNSATTLYTSTMIRVHKAACAHKLRALYVKLGAVYGGDLTYFIGTPGALGALMKRPPTKRPRNTLTHMKCPPN
jgi:hypothetical protein